MQVKNFRESSSAVCHPDDKETQPTDNDDNIKSRRMMMVKEPG